MLKISALKMICFYQCFLSVLKAPCCRYYPSCSSYAYQSFEKNNVFVAFWASFLRILRCNAYFKGGFDYPKINRKKIKLTQGRLSSRLKFLYIPCAKDEFYIVKIVFKGK